MERPRLGLLDTLGLRTKSIRRFPIILAPLFDDLRSLCMLLWYRNSAAQTVNQKLVFVGSEEGKLLAIRQIFNEVSCL